MTASPALLLHSLLYKCSIGMSSDPASPSKGAATPNYSIVYPTCIDLKMLKLCLNVHYCSNDALNRVRKEKILHTTSCIVKQNNGDIIIFNFIKYIYIYIYIYIYYICMYIYIYI